MANSINIRIDVRSSLSLLVLAVVAVLVTVFLLEKASEAIDEINTLSETPAFLGNDGK